GTTGFAQCVNWYGFGLPPSFESLINWITVFGQLAFASLAAFGFVLLLRHPRRAGARTMTLMLIAFAVYGVGWIANATYWTIRWWAG
ncbi:MAG: hypothetical protein KDA28_14390, partial [Phycisphaerales bacterium]|nr:hypothetical protein [Phycisphaerales bacterium]